MLVLKWLVGAIVMLVGAIAAGQVGLLSGSPPGDLGVRDGKLKGLSSTSNSVSSQAGLYPDHPQLKYATVEPLPLRGSGADTVARIKAVVESMDGSKVIKSEPDYLYAQYTTPLMKFVDDVEFWFDPVAQVVQVRSASRLGKGDRGLNRKRVEAVRAALTAAP